MAQNKPSEHVDALLPAYVNGSLDPRANQLVRDHLQACAPCQRELANWKSIGLGLDSTIGPTVLPRADFLNAVWARIDDLAPESNISASAGRIDRPPFLQINRAAGATTSATTIQRTERYNLMTQLRQSRVLRPLVAGAAAAALAAAVVFTPVGSYAEGFLTIFTPTQFTAVPVTVSDLQSLPKLADYGTFSAPTHQTPQKVASAAEASAASKLTVLAPSTQALPAGLPTTARYDVLPGGTTSFTFSAAKAASTAAAKGKTAPTIPANIDGSSVTVTTGPAVVAFYGQPPTPKNLSTATGQQSAESLAMNAGPVLVIAQSTAPVVASNGASIQDLEHYLIAQPGFPTDLANALTSIGDPSTTLPIPVPVNRALSHPVTVQGVPGLAVADSSGLGGGVIWQNNGVVYGVAGSFTENQLLAVANSLR